MKLIDADALCEDLIERWNLADKRKEELIRAVMADVVTPIVALQPTIEQSRWIPVTEKMPEEDVEVLISYRYKDGEGDTSHVYIDITTYGQRCFGGNKVGNHKHWRAPFAYFESNYEVIAWMPMPEPYREGGEQE